MGKCFSACALHYSVRKQYILGIWSFKLLKELRKDLGEACLWNYKDLLVALGLRPISLGVGSKHSLRSLASGAWLSTPFPCLEHLDEPQTPWGNLYTDVSLRVNTPITPNMDFQSPKWEVNYYWHKYKFHNLPFILANVHGVPLLCQGCMDWRYRVESDTDYPFEEDLMIYCRSWQTTAHGPNMA